MFYSTADKQHVRQFGSRPAQQKSRTTTAARPHVFYSTAVHLHPTTVWPRALPGENDPWRFRQQSSRVISIPFWYLTSLVTSLSVGSDPVFHNGRMQNLFLLGGFLRVCFGSYCLGSLAFTCTLVSPLCTCMIASVFPFCKTGYSINPPQNLCVKRRFLSFPQFPVDFISCA